MSFCNEIHIWLKGIQKNQNVFSVLFCCCLYKTTSSFMKSRRKYKILYVMPFTISKTSILLPILKKFTKPSPVFLYSDVRHIIWFVIVQTFMVHVRVKMAIFISVFFFRKYKLWKAFMADDGLLLRDNKNDEP